MTTDNLAALKTASEGLLFPSETDAPIEVIDWPGEQGKPEKARVLELAGLPPTTAVKSKSLVGFFKDVTKDETWHDDEEKAQVQKFKQLVQALKDTLSDIKVFQAGKVECDVFVVGCTESGWAGVKTKVVET
jgi:hypothetical protein